MARWTGAIAERLASFPLVVGHVAPGTEVSDLAADGLDGPAPWAREAAKRSLDEGRTHYTTRPGLTPLREAVAEHLNRRHGIDLTADDVVITDGSTEAIHVAARIVLAGPGAPRGERRLLAADPGWPTGPATARWLDAPVVALPTADGQLDLDRLEAGAGGVLLVANPSHPEGRLMSPATARALAEAVTRHDLRLILDETLADARLPGRELLSPLLDPEVVARTVLAGSFSIAQRLAGWRVGYLAAKTGPLRPMRSLKQAISICSAAVAQYAALGALRETPPEWYAGQAEAGAERLSRAAARLEAAGLPCPPPDCYPFLWVDVGAAGARGDAAKRLREAGIAVAPGERFGRSGAGHVRLTLDPAGPDPLPAVDRLIQALGEAGR